MYFGLFHMMCSIHELSHMHDFGVKRAAENFTRSRVFGSSDNNINARAETSHYTVIA
jgi:hypothetical protein